jgi:hypothetical protein
VARALSELWLREMFSAHRQRHSADATLKQRVWCLQPCEHASFGCLTSCNETRCSETVIRFADLKAPMLSPSPVNSGVKCGAPKKRRPAAVFSI